MKLGIVIILIGVAWCVRCYLLRPQPLEIPVATAQRHELSFSSESGVTSELPYYHPGVVYVSLPDSPEEGETIEYTHWTAPSKTAIINGVRHPGGSMSSRVRVAFTFTNGQWVETDRYPREGSLPQ